MSIEVKAGQQWRFVFPKDYKSYNGDDNVDYVFTISEIVNNGYEAIGDMIYDDGVVLYNVTNLIESMKTVCYWSLLEDIE